MAAESVFIDTNVLVAATVESHPSPCVIDWHAQAAWASVRRSQHGFAASINAVSLSMSMGLARITGRGPPSN